MKSYSARLPFVVVCLSLLVPFAIVVIIFEFVGIGSAIYSIVLPIFLGVGLLLLVIFGLVFGGISYAMSSSTSRIQKQTSMGSRSLFETSRRPVFIVPAECPICNREFRLNYMEWRDESTMICPGCFEDIRIERSRG